MHAFQQRRLLVRAGAAKGQEVPSERQEAFLVGDAEGQEAPRVFQVGAIHDQIDLLIRPVGKQIADERLVTVGGAELLVFQGAPQVLNQVLAAAR